MSTILLVEDQAICREVLAKLLRYEGFEVATAGNGIQALDRLKQSAVDLLLLDLVLPKLTGLALLEQLRSQDRWRHLPVIAVTGWLDSAQINRAIALNARQVFSKASFSVEELIATIRQSLLVNVG